MLRGCGSLTPHVPGLSVGLPRAAPEADRYPEATNGISKSPRGSRQSATTGYFTTAVGGMSTTGTLIFATQNRGGAQAASFKGFFIISLIFLIFIIKFYKKKNYNF